MTVASFVISVLAFLVGGASLGWNILNYLLTGQRATVEVASMRLLSSVGKELEPVVQVTVRATGRVPVEVTGWSVAFPDNMHLHSAIVGMQYGNLASIYLGDELPKLIDPGRSAYFNIPTIAIEKSAEVHDLDLSMAYVNVYFAARKSIRSKGNVSEIVGKASENKR